jgi:hypothetical protein
MTYFYFLKIRLGEAEMTPETILLRQIHPLFIVDNQVTSQAFTPFPKDEGLLSMYDGSLVTAAESHQHYTDTLKFQSAAVYAVSVAEVTIESAGVLTCRPDPLPDFESHAVIDFTGQTEKAARKLAKKLKKQAIDRGCLFHGPRQSF